MPQARPHLLVNVAMTADGKIDSFARQGALISSERDITRVDRLRAEADAVLVGGRTLLGDDPRLTVRSPELRQERRSRGLPENPIKVGVVTIAALKLESRFVNAGPARRLVFTTSQTPPEQVARLQEAGVEVFLQGDAQVDLSAVLASLYNLGVRQLLVEGGGTLIAELFRLGLVDELTLYIAPLIFAGTSAPTLADGTGFLPEQAPSLRLVSFKKFDEAGGLLVHYSLERKE